MYFNLGLHPLGHICGIGHVNFQCKIHTLRITTYNTYIESNHYNTINSNTKFKQIDITTSGICILI
jgi:hypothetical protein